jgi:hypothetical protein
MAGFLNIMVSAHRTAFFASIIIIAGFSTASQTSAATVAAAQATEMLARAHAIQQKCKFLNARQNHVLSNFVAKAEIAMATKSSTTLTNRIIANGRSQGQKATCSNVERADIIDIIKAAQQATASSRPLKTQKSVRLIPTANKPNRLQKLFSTNGLAQYAELTKRYYLARRCSSMSASSINTLYRNVVATHRNVLSNFGVPVVRAIMRQSEQRANQSSCG